MSDKPSTNITFDDVKVGDVKVLEGLTKITHLILVIAPSDYY